MLDTVSGGENWHKDSVRSL